MADDLVTHSAPQPTEPLRPSEVAPPPAVVPVAPVSRPPSTKPPESKGTSREIVETIVFVVVLVLLLQTFVAEAFVIPTGSMAPTLYGYQKKVTCDQCGHEFAVNCSSEIEPQEGMPKSYIEGCVCPNCQFKKIWVTPADNDRGDPNGQQFRFESSPGHTVKFNVVSDDIPSWNSGDRVLVSKYPYEFSQAPNRFDVVVFRFPDNPQKHLSAINFIKRLLGLPFETIAIYQGNLYVTRALQPTWQPTERQKSAPDPRSPEMMFVNNQAALDRFDLDVTKGQASTDGFELIRKSPETLLAMRRIVFDNDKQPRDLKAAGVIRWDVDGLTPGAWKLDTPTENSFTRTESSDQMEWIKYQHRPVVRSNLEPAKNPTTVQPTLIRDALGYNSDIKNQRVFKEEYVAGKFWCTDLITECDVTHQGQGTFVLEVARGLDRFQARFDLTTGVCTLVRITADRTTGVEKESVVATQATRLHERKSQATKVRFANVDQRLTVWVNGMLPFDDGVDYKLSTDHESYDPNDRLRPTRIGAEKAPGLTVSHVQLWRDLYYWPSDQWGNDKVQTYYVQPDHYFCLGDNSAASHDSRGWGTVPQRLLLGRAVSVYWPPSRIRLIR